MLSRIGEKEDISLLEAKLKNETGDDINAKLARDRINKAIKAIKEREGLI